MNDSEVTLIIAGFALVGSFLEIISWILRIIGSYLILKKLKHPKPKLGLIPSYRYYMLAKVSGREPDGRKYFFIDATITIIQIIVKFIDPNATDNPFIALTFLIIVVPVIIYRIRIYFGLCDTFCKKRRWTLLFMPCEGILLIWWALSKKIIPVAAVTDEDGVSVEDSSLQASAKDNSLTVNIKERSVIDFFKKKTLLRDIHLNIPTGHMVLLLGGSGAGKTTFLNAVTGYEKANAEIELGKKNIYTEYKSMKYDIGFVPQADLMRGNDTVYRTVADAASLRLPTNMKMSERKAAVDHVLNIFGLTAVKSSLVDKLSGGQRKRLSIAMEFISDPTLFILDEPDSGLDGVVARGLFEKLRNIADEGKIVMVITHTPDRVIDLFDDVIVLAKDSGRTGRLAYYGPIKRAYEFFGKTTMEDILLSINQKEEGGEGLADNFVKKYAASAMDIVGGEI